MNQYLEITDTFHSDELTAELNRQFESDKEFIKGLSMSLTYSEQIHEENARILDDIRNREEYNEEHIAELIALIPEQYFRNEFIAQNYSGKDYSLLQLKVLAEMAGRM